MPKKTISRKKLRERRERENGFNLSAAPSNDIPDYNSLYDQNLRHYFDNRRTQQFLYKCGMIDREGRVVDLEKNKSKLFIIEQEFKHAEQEEFWRLKEEAEFRRRIQIKRHEALEQARRTQRINDLKSERMARRERIALAKYGKQGMPGATVKGGSGAKASAAEMEKYLQSVFEQADVNGDGFLDHAEFKALLRNADLGLSNEDVKRVMSEADEDEDGFINYTEFVPVAVQVLQGYHARRNAIEHRDKDEEKAHELAMDYLLHGMSREELEATMFKLFQKADLDQDGFLDRNEFRGCINDASLNLSRREVNLLMAEADGDAKGKISYDEFVPLCFDLLLKNLQDDIFLLQRNRGELENYLLEIFQYADAEACGLLMHSDIINLLELANLGLSQLQIATIVSAATRDKKGQIAYHKFISVAAEMIAEMFHANMLSDRKRGQPAPQDVNDLSSEELHTFLTKLFVSAAGGEIPEGSSVLLAPRDFKRVLLATDVGFTPEQMRRMLVEADESEEGMIDVTKFTQSAVDVIETMRTKPTFQDQERLREREAEELARDFSVHDHSREQLESVLADLFLKHDNAQSGQVTRSTLFKVVHEMESLMSLERREVNALMISADEDNDGLLSYQEFIPLAYDVLRQSILDILIDSTPHSAQLQEYIVDLCRAEDPKLVGKLASDDIKLILASSDLQLSQSQLDTLMEYASGPNVDYTEFAAAVCTTLQEMLSQPSEGSESFDWSQIQEAEVQQFLDQLFKDAEEEAGTNTDKIRYGSIKKQLSSIDMGGGNVLTPQQVREVLKNATADDYGLVNYKEFVPVAAASLKGLGACTMLEVLEGGFNPDNVLVGGRTTVELEQELEASLQRNDTNRSGSVSHRQFADALEAMGLLPDWVAYSLAFTEEDAQGNTSVTPEIIKAVVAGLAALQQVAQLEKQRSQPPPLSKQLLEVFAAADTEGTGNLDSATVKNCLRDLGLGLKERHIITIISAAEKKNDMINYTSFSKYAAGVIGEIAAKEQEVVTEPVVTVKVNQYREACREVAAIERSALYHLRALQPEGVPNGISKVFTYIGKLLARDTGSWFKIKEMVSAQNFLGDVAGVDPRSLSDELQKELTELVNDPDCAPDCVSRPSTSQYFAAVTLAKWCQALLKECQ